MENSIGTNALFGVYSFAESRPLPINLSIVQGSGLGPSFYNVYESDLKPLSSDNIIFKYADDTNLLVPEHTDVQLCDEFDAIQKWAVRNKMIINVAKTKEIVFRRPNPRMCIDVAPLFGIEQVKEIKLLGVIFSEDLRFNSHVNFILKLSSQRSYIMKKLRDQGLCRKQLNIVFDAIILSRIMYAVCAWSSFLSQELKGRIDAFLRRMHKYGFCQFVFNFQEIADDYDLGLYRAMLNDNSCIHQLLPAKNAKSCNSVIEDTIIHYQSANMICIKTLLSIDAYINMFNFFLFLFYLWTCLFTIIRIILMYMAQ
jgi:hypothetical protein